MLVITVVVTENILEYMGVSSFIVVICVQEKFKSLKVESFFVAIQGKFSWLLFVSHRRELTDKGTLQMTE